MQMTVQNIVKERRHCGASSIIACKNDNRITLFNWPDKGERESERGFAKSKWQRTPTLCREARAGASNRRAKWSRLIIMSCGSQLESSISRVIILIFFNQLSLSLSLSLFYLFLSNTYLKFHKLHCSLVKQFSKYKWWSLVLSLHLGEILFSREDTKKSSRTEMFSIGGL